MTACSDRQNRILNYSEDQEQVIGRVYRTGQNMPTVRGKQLMQ
jgi:hypothetical protein